MELSWIGVALVFGLAAKKLGQAPLVGFLAAGFFLSAVGVNPGQTLEDLAQVGVLLLLFAIGLKVDIPALLRPHIFAASLLHTAAMVLLGGAILYIPVFMELGPFAGLSFPAVAILGLFTAFSSTLFVIKVLEERENMETLYGRVIIGFLVMQDLVAVALLAVSKGGSAEPLGHRAPGAATTAACAGLHTSMVRPSRTPDPRRAEPDPGRGRTI